MQLPKITLAISNHRPGEPRGPIDPNRQFPCTGLSLTRPSTVPVVPRLIWPRAVDGTQAQREVLRRWNVDTGGIGEFAGTVWW
jgi:hypothetical protein